MMARERANRFMEYDLRSLLAPGTDVERVRTLLIEQIVLAQSDERRAIAAWLRSQAVAWRAQHHHAEALVMASGADAIERGEHAGGGS